MDLRNPLRRLDCEGRMKAFKIGDRVKNIKNKNKNKNRIGVIAKFGICYGCEIAYVQWENNKKTAKEYLTSLKKDDSHV